MNREGFIAAVENLLGTKGYPDPKDEEVLILEDKCLRIEFYSENEMGIFNSEGWPCCLAMIGENPKHSADAATVSSWEHAYSSVEFGHERSLSRYNDYEAYLLAAIETCKTHTKNPVNYVMGSSDQRPCAEVFLRELPDIRLYRMEVYATGHVVIHQPYTDVEDSVDRWFIRNNGRLESGIVHVLEVFDNKVADDSKVAAMLQIPDLCVSSRELHIKKTSEPEPDWLNDFYVELMAPEHRKFIEFAVW